MCPGSVSIDRLEDDIRFCYSVSSLIREAQRRLYSIRAGCQGQFHLSTDCRGPVALLSLWLCEWWHVIETEFLDQFLHRPSEVPTHPACPACLSDINRSFSTARCIFCSFCQTLNAIQTVKFRCHWYIFRVVHRHAVYGITDLEIPFY